LLSTQESQITRTNYETFITRPYTFILPAAKNVPKKLWSKRKTVGIRIPDHLVALKIVEGLGNPIVSTSTTTRKGELLLDRKK